MRMVLEDRSRIAVRVTRVLSEVIDAVCPRANCRAAIDDVV